MGAIDAIEELIDLEIYHPSSPHSSEAEQPQSYKEGVRRAARSVQDHDRYLNLQLMESLRSLDAMLEASRSFDVHKRMVRSVQGSQEDPDVDLEAAISSFASLMLTASSMTHQEASAKEKYILGEVRESYNDLNAATIKVLDDSYEAFKLVEASKTKLETLVKAVKSEEIHGIVHKISSSGKSKAKRSVDQELRPRMVPRGFNKQEYKWLSKEFDLSKQEVDKVYMLSEEEFLKFSRSLQKADVSSNKNGYSAEDLIEVFKTARQIVPAELEAAALGIVEAGKHIGGRARQAVDPVVSLVRDTVIPGTGKLVVQAVDAVPEDVKDWVGQGGRLASKRVDAVVEFLGPRLTQVARSINYVQERLTETAGDAIDQASPTIVPVLQSVVQELQETLDYARSSLPPVSDRAQSLYQSVSNQVEPYTDSLGQTIRHDVAPTLKDVLKGSLNAVFTGVPKVIKQISHEAHDAAKVFSKNYQAVLQDIQTQQIKKKDL